MSVLPEPLPTPPPADDGARVGTAVTIGPGVTRTVAEIQALEPPPATVETLREQIRPGQANPGKQSNPDSPVTDRFPSPE